MTETPAPRHTRWLWVAAIGALAITAAVAGTFGVITARHDADAQRAAAFTSPAASPSAVVVPLSEAAACVRLVPLLGDSAKQVTAVITHPDGSTADWGLIYRTHDQLTELAPALPESMRTDVNIQLSALDTLDRIGHQQAAPRDLDTNGFSDAGLRIAHTCLKYATG